VFAGLVGSMLGYPILDPVAGVLVAGVIIKQAVIIGKDSLRDLSDAPASVGETDSLRKTCLSVTGVLQVQELKARKSGPFLFVETTVGVDGSISASAAHRLAEITRLALLSKHYGRVANAVVHVSPIGSSGLGEKYPSWARDHGFIEQEIRKAVKKITEIHAVSEVQVYYKDDGLISAKVDILLPSNLTIHQAHAIAGTYPVWVSCVCVCVW
jgi:divalent metal cation (Fe/Co/Zn/Cd) transporter